MQIHSVGIDLGKTTFHLVAPGAAGKVLVRKNIRSKKRLSKTGNAFGNNAFSRGALYSVPLPQKNYGRSAPLRAGFWLLRGNDGGGHFVLVFEVEDLGAAQPAQQDNARGNRL
jgi:hypothetical protein